LAQSCEALVVAGLCLLHWRYGNAADSCHSCHNPCSWMGN
jgi:hypothetical protein